MDGYYLDIFEKIIIINFWTNVSYYIRQYRLLNVDTGKRWVGSQ